MSQPGFDKHQLAGFDARERGFSRPIEFEQNGEQVQAVFRYETIRVEGEPHGEQDEALKCLIAALHAQGYRQLRTQRSFRAGVYLGSQELWVEYPDPPSPPERRGLLARLVGCLRPRRAND